MRISSEMAIAISSPARLLVVQTGQRGMSAQSPRNRNGLVKGSQEMAENRAAQFKARNRPRNRNRLDCAEPKNRRKRRCAIGAQSPRNSKQPPYTFRGVLKYPPQGITPGMLRFRFARELAHRSIPTTHDTTEVPA